MTGANGEHDDRLRTPQTGQSISQNDYSRTILSQNDQRFMGLMFTLYQPRHIGVHSRLSCLNQYL